MTDMRHDENRLGASSLQGALKLAGRERASSPPAGPFSSVSLGDVLGGIALFVFAVAVFIFMGVL